MSLLDSSKSSDLSLQPRPLRIRQVTMEYHANTPRQHANANTPSPHPLLSTPHPLFPPTPSTCCYGDLLHQKYAIDNLFTRGNE